MTILFFATALETVNGAYLAKLRWTFSFMFNKSYH